MGTFSDLAKSLIRTGLDKAREQGRIPERMKRAVREITSQGSECGEQALGSALAQTSGVTSLSATARRGQLQLHASFEGHDPLSGELALDAIRFAPRGAKELVLRWSPQDNARHPMVRPLVGTLAGVVAHHLWAVVLGPPTGDMSGAIVDRDGAQSFRVDLRTVPAVRAAIRKGAPGMVVDTLSLADLRFDEGAMGLRFRLPSLMPR